MILVLNCGSQSIKYKIFENDLSLVKEKKIEEKSEAKKEPVKEAKKTEEKKKEKPKRIRRK